MLCRKCEAVLTCTVWNWKRLKYISKYSPEASTPDHDDHRWIPSGQRRLKHHHHQTISGLRKSAKAGCRLCAKILFTCYEGPAAGRRWIYENANVFDYGRVVRGISDKEFDQLKYSIDALWQVLNAPTTNARLESVEIISGLTGACVPLRPLELDSEFRASQVDKQYMDVCDNLPDMIRKIKTWLELCKNEHSNCGDGVGFVPSRLLHLGGPDSKTWQLQEFDKKSSGTIYATLSHRWGKVGPALQLSPKTWKKFKEGLSDEDLPRAFKEAVHMTRLLGVKYIWIDALCILQGEDEESKRDWRRHATLMDDIYKDGFINFSIIEGVDSHTPLFPTRRRDQVAPCPVESTTYSEVRTRIQMVKRKAYLLESMDFHSHVEMSPVNRRGWVLQERVLAPRTLYFCNEKIYWECKEYLDSDLSPRPFCSAMSSLTDWKSKKNLLSDLEKSKQSIDSGHGGETGLHVDRIVDAWNALLATYSCCELSYATDTFFAIEGLASHFRPLIDGPRRCFAGLWEWKLDHSLLWRPDYVSMDRYGIVPPKIRNPMHLPTWSWAAFGLPISLNMLADEQWRSLVDVRPIVEEEKEGDDKGDDLIITSHVHLEMTCPPLLHMTKSPSPSGDNLPDIVASVDRFFPEDHPLWGHNPILELCWDVRPPQDAPPPTLLVIGASEYYRPQTRRALRGLIVEASGENVDGGSALGGTFRRVGMWELTTSVLLDSVVRSLQEKGREQIILV